jgi:hypothetical protein
MRAESRVGRTRFCMDRNMSKLENEDTIYRMRSTTPWLQSCLNFPVPVLFQVRPLVCQLRRCDGGGFWALESGRVGGLKGPVTRYCQRPFSFQPQDPAAIIIARLGRRGFGNSRELPEKRRVRSSNHAEGREVRERSRDISSLAHAKLSLGSQHLHVGGHVGTSLGPLQPVEPVELPTTGVRASWKDHTE